MAGRNTCPSCGAEVTDDAVLCVKCGYDFGTKRRIRSVLDTSAREPARPGRTRTVLVVGLLCLSGVALAVALTLRKAGSRPPAQQPGQPVVRRTTEETVLPGARQTPDTGSDGQAGQGEVPEAPPLFLVEGGPHLQDSIDESALWDLWFEAPHAGQGEPLVYFRLDKAVSTKRGRHPASTSFHLTVVALETGRILLACPEGKGIAGTLSLKIKPEDMPGLELEEVIDVAAVAAMAARPEQHLVFAKVLTDTMKERRGLLRRAAALALARLGDSGPSALASFAQSDEKALRLLAVDTLARMGAGAATARPALAKALAEDLARALDHGDADTRKAVVLALGSITPGDKDAAAALAAHLSDPSEEVRKAAVTSLADRGPDVVGHLTASFRDKSEAVAGAARAAVVRIGPPAVPELARALGRPDDPKTEHAAFALEKIGEKHRTTWTDIEDVTPLLLTALLDEDMRMRPPLARFGARAVPAVARVLEDSDNREIRRAALVIFEMMGGEARGAVPVLIPILRDQDPELRDRAIRILGRLGPHAAAAAPALVEALSDEEEAVRDAAARVLAGLGPHAKPALPALVKAVREGDLLVLAGASQALGRMGSDALPAVPALIDAIGVVDEKTAGCIISALGNIGTEAKRAAPTLIRILQNDRAGWAMRQAAASALGKTGGDGALEALGKALSESPGEPLRFAAAAALGQLGAEAAPILARALGSPERGTRKQAALALSRLGPAAEPALPALVSTLLDNDGYVRLGVMEALASLGEIAAPALADALSDDALRPQVLLVLEKMGPSAAAALPALERLLERPAQAARIQAIRALGEIGTRAGAAIIGRLEHSDAGTRRAAAAALGEISPPPPGAVSSLARALSDENPKVREQAAISLGELGPAADAAVPALVEAMRQGHVQARSALLRIGPVSAPALVGSLEDRDEGVRRAAASILAGIGPEAKPAVPALLKALRDSDAGVRGAALRALKSIDLGGPSIDRGKRPE